MGKAMKIKMALAIGCSIILFVGATLMLQSSTGVNGLIWTVAILGGAVLIDVVGSLIIALIEERKEK